MEYLLPEILTPASLHDQLCSFAPLKAELPREGCLCYFDSFDWRLFHQGLILEEETLDGSPALRLRRLGNVTVNPAHLAELPAMRHSSAGTPTNDPATVHRSAWPGDS